jgi:type IV pilus assembly protein PilE
MYSLRDPARSAGRSNKREERAKVKTDRSSSGFTLIELMITVAIIAIIAAVALPSYQSSVQRSRRADAHALLQAAQLAQEKYRLNNTTYAATANLGNAAFRGVCITVGGQCRSSNNYYTLTMTNNTAANFTLTATAIGSQATDSACSAITLTQVAGTVTPGPAACWPK